MVDLVWDTLRLRRLKASLLAACANEGLYKLFDVLEVQQPSQTLRSWTARDPDALEYVEAALAGAGMSIDSVMACTLSKRMDDIVRIDRMAMAAEVRRNAILREIERRRAGFGQRLRSAAEEAGTPKMIAKAPVLEPA